MKLPFQDSFFIPGDVVCYKYAFWNAIVIKASYKEVTIKRTSDGEVFNFAPEYLTLGDHTNVCHIQDALLEASNWLSQLHFALVVKHGFKSK